MVIIYSKEYSEKVHYFFMANNFNTLAKEPTEKFQKLIHNVARKNLIMDKRQIKHMTQTKAAPPKFKPN